MHLLWVVIIGFLAGLIARFLTADRTPAGFVVTAVLGVVGSLVATWLGQAVGWYGPGEKAHFLGAVVGAVIILAVYHAVSGRRSL